MELHLVDAAVVGLAASCGPCNHFGTVVGQISPATGAAPLICSDKVLVKTHLHHS
jgi:hypothetical protein